LKWDDIKSDSVEIGKSLKYELIIKRMRESRRKRQDLADERLKRLYLARSVSDYYDNNKD
jgi:hypothetical protein